MPSLISSLCTCLGKNAIPDCDLAMLKQNGEMCFHKLGHLCNTNYETKRRCANAVYHPAAHIMLPEYFHPACLYVYLSYIINHYLEYMSSLWELWSKWYGWLWSTGQQLRSTTLEMKRATIQRFSLLDFYWQGMRWYVLPKFSPIQL